MTRRLPLPLAQLALSGMNHVLQQQPSARDRMQAHAGRQVRVVILGPLDLGPFGGSVYSDARIDKDGFLAIAGDGPPAVVLTLKPGVESAFAALRAGPAGIGSEMKIEGDVLLAAALGQVAQSLRWDYEEDLSRVLGDVMAHRIGRLARGLRQGADGLRHRASEALQRGATGRDGPLASGDHLAELARDIERLAADIDRLEAGASLAQRRPYAFRPGLASDR